MTERKIKKLIEIVEKSKFFKEVNYIRIYRFVIRFISTQIETNIFFNSFQSTENPSAVYTF